MVASHRCAVQYHNQNPQFNDEIKVQLPCALNCEDHLLFEFKHIAVANALSPKTSNEVYCRFTYTSIEMVLILRIYFSLLSCQLATLGFPSRRRFAALTAQPCQRMYRTLSFLYRPISHLTTLNISRAVSLYLKRLCSIRHHMISFNL